MGLSLHPMPGPLGLQAPLSKPLGLNTDNHGSPGHPCRCWASHAPWPRVWRARSEVKAPGQPAHQPLPLQGHS